MKISDAIGILENAFDIFGDVEVRFTDETGTPALEMGNVDSANKPIEEFTDADIFIDPPHNRFSRS